MTPLAIHKVVQLIRAVGNRLDPFEDGGEILSNAHVCKRFALLPV
jgi:hypothetical protein